MLGCGRCERPTFFRTQSIFRKWLEKNHDRTPGLVVGFHRVDSGKSGLACRGALCFGWIDRLPSMEELIKLGRVHEAGRKTYRQRDKKRSKLYSHEVGNCRLAAEFEPRCLASPTT